jgi:transposase-like protein
MAQKMNCPKCKAKNVSVIKKGFNAKGQQRWKCTKCGKSFIIDDSPIVRKSKTAKKVKVTTPKSKKTKKSNFETIIKVNNNVVKSVNRNLKSDEAFDLVSDYFREITKTDVRVTSSKNSKTIVFTVKTGTKG